MTIVITNKTTVTITIVIKITGTITIATKLFTISVTHNFYN